ncbi:hypothetical protein QJS66_19200 [Kocuria rhizophila]|nr:hypothetical protein QJS66_19200 [Kocuria rhizophila]
MARKSSHTADAESPGRIWTWPSGGGTSSPELRCSVVGHEKSWCCPATTRWPIPPAWTWPSCPRSPGGAARGVRGAALQNRLTSLATAAVSVPRVAQVAPDSWTLVVLVAAQIGCALSLDSVRDNVSSGRRGVPAPRPAAAAAGRPARVASGRPYSSPCAPWCAWPRPSTGTPRPGRQAPRSQRVRNRSHQPWPVLRP